MRATSEPIVIGRRYCGPADSGNGGYACGSVAAQLGAATAEVTLRSPPPLETPLEMTPAGDGIRVLHGDALVAEARAVEEIGLEPPRPVRLDEATRAAARSWINSSPEEHPFPTCFVCGPRRAAGDGLRVFVGPVDDGRVCAAPWTPDSSLVGRDGRVSPVFVWSVLDCAGGIAAGYERGERVPWPPHVLGRLAAEVHDEVSVGEQCVAVGWRIREDGRKLFVGSALFGADERLVGLAGATWIELR
jgi:hypothetical protein